MGIKSFFSKIGNGLKAGYNWVRNTAVPFVQNKVLPAVSRIIKPALGFASMLPGKIGQFGKIGQGIADTVTNIADKIPNAGVRDKITGFVNKINDKVQGGVNKGQDIANRANDTINKGIGVATDIYNAAKQGINATSQVVKPAIKDM